MQLIGMSGYIWAFGCHESENPSADSGVRHNPAASRDHDGELGWTDGRPRRRTAAAATFTQSRYGAKVQALPWGRTAQAPIRVLPLFDGSAQRDH